MDKNPSRNQHYLNEDNDLLDELGSMGPTAYGVGQADQSRKLLTIQIKSVLRNRKTADNLDKSTTKFSRVLILLAIVQILIAGFQFVLDAGTSQDKVYAFFVSAAFLGLLYFITNKKI